MSVFVVNFELLVWWDFQLFKKFCGVDEDDFFDMFVEICRFDLKFGSGFFCFGLEMIVLDIVVLLVGDGGWNVELNFEIFLCVLVNQIYYVEVLWYVLCDSVDQVFLSECMQNVNWLMCSFDQWVCMIFKVVIEIVWCQDSFLCQGVDGLKLLNLKIVVDVIKMYEFIVSCVMFNKFMMMLCGVYELKYFFIVLIFFVEGGDGYLVEVVCNCICLMINEEMVDIVFFDDDIVDIFKVVGIDIVWCMVVKYCDVMNIFFFVQCWCEKKVIVCIVL